MTDIIIPDNLPILHAGNHPEGLLDEFDRLTSRVNVVMPTAESWERVLVAGSAA